MQILILGIRYWKDIIGYRKLCIKLRKDSIDYRKLGIEIIKYNIDYRKVNMELCICIMEEQKEGRAIFTTKGTKGGQHKGREAPCLLVGYRVVNL